MSQTTTSSVTFTIAAHVPTGEELLLQELRSLCPQLEAIPSSMALAGLSAPQVHRPGGHRRRINDGTSIGRLRSRFAALSATGGATELVAATAGSTLAKARRLLREGVAAREAGQTGRAESLASRGDRALRSALAAPLRRLRKDERVLAASALEQALASRGFRTRTTIGETSTGIEGRREGQVVLGVVHDGGMIQADQAGFDGTSCKPLWREVRRRMHELGAQVEEIEVVDHADEQGGTLIQRSALAAEGRSLDYGAVRQHEHPEVLSAPTGVDTAAISEAARIPTQRLGQEGA